MSDIQQYMVCESGIYSQDQYNDLDEGRGVLEIGQIIYVDVEIVPEDLMEDDETLVKHIHDYLHGKIEKPLWIV